MNKSVSTGALSLLWLLGCSSPPPVDQVARAQQVDAARRALAERQYDEALAITDELLAQNPEDREALLLAADGNIGLFESGRSGQELFLQDAIRNLRRALDLSAGGPEQWETLGDLYLKNGQFAKGRDAALEAAKQWRDREADIAVVCNAVMLAAANEMQMFVEARRPEREAEEEVQPATAQLAAAVVARCEFARAGQPGRAVMLAGQVYLWLDKGQQALELYERGLEEVPGDPDLHDAFQRMYAQRGMEAECVAAYERLLETQPESSLLLWHKGRAEVANADALRRRGQPAEALAAYGDAVETFGRYRALNPRHSANTDHWLAICNISRTAVALDTADVEAAREYSLASFQNTPRVAELDANGVPVIRDSENFSYLAGLGRIGAALLEPPNDPRALERALGYYDELIERHPDTFGFLYNNAALAARDLGTAYEGASRAPDIDESERQRNLARAMELWEKSYTYYEKAVALEPNDARIVNDCGLVLVYCLHRDYDRARELFDHAIEVGQPVIDALPENADVEERNLAEEAVGDAYQNIAVMLRQKGAPFAEYRSSLESAVKYYPYNTRSAAALLRTHGESDGTAVPAAQSPRSTGNATEREFARVKKEAEAKAEQGDFDGALLVLDDAAEDLQGFAGYHQLVGTYSLRYATQARANGGSLAQIDGLYADAIRQLQQAIELDNQPIEPRLELTRAYLDSGDVAAAAHTADKLLSHIASVGGAAPETLVAIHRVRGDAYTRVYIAAVQNEDPGHDALLKARSSFERLEEQGQLGTLQIQQWTSLEQWAGQPERAIEILTRAVRREPDSEVALQQLVETASSTGKSDLAVEALADREDATGVWFRGLARFHQAQQQWIGGDNNAAVDTLSAAIGDFEASKAANADFSSTADQWTSFCLGSQGVIQIANGQTGRAAKSLLRAAELSPAQVTADLDGTNTIKRSILVLGNKFYTDGDVARAELLFRRAAELVPQDSDFANNHGLMARDYGVQLERNGNTEKAAEMFEASYRSYVRAAELEPDSIRLANDVALMLIYHLDRDLERARDLLLETIAKGEARLKDDPPGDRAELRDLQEAIGDCYQNLGVWFVRHGDDEAAARKAFEKSMTFYPFDQRASAAELRRLNEKQEAGKDKEPGK